VVECKRCQRNVAAGVQEFPFRSIVVCCALWARSDAQKGPNQVDTISVSSLCRFGIDFRPERRLNCAGSLMPEVGHDPGPIHDAALSPRQALLRFLELALGVTHTLTLGSVELWVCEHAGCQTLKLRIVHSGVSECSLERQVTHPTPRCASPSHIGWALYSPSTSNYRCNLTFGALWHSFTVREPLSVPREALR